MTVTLLEWKKTGYFQSLFLYPFKNLMAISIFFFFCYWVPNLFIKRQTLYTLNYAFVCVYSIGLFTPVKPLLALLQHLLLSFCVRKLLSIQVCRKYQHFLISYHLDISEQPIELSFGWWISCKNSSLIQFLYMLRHSVWEKSQLSHPSTHVLPSPSCSVNGLIPKMSLVLMKAPCLNFKSTIISAVM